MKKLFGFKIGGLQQKIFNLVLVFLVAIIGVFGAVSAYQSRELTSVVNNASQKQQQAIEKSNDDGVNAPTLIYDDYGQVVGQVEGAPEITEPETDTPAENAE